MKNTFHQALACIEFAEIKNKTLRFHVNTSRIEQSGENVVKNLRAIFENNWFSFGCKQDRLLDSLAN